MNTDASMGMQTTGGTLALVGSTTRKNAPVIDRLLDAGVIGQLSLGFAIDAERVQCWARPT